MWLDAFATALQAQNVIYLLAGTAIGLVIGALPGLGPLFGVSLALPFTFGMPAATSIIFLVSIHAATAYGDSIASILINTPGGIGSVAACWDGYPLAKKGKAAMALGISTFGSLLGGIIGWITLVLIAPVLTAFAMQIGAPEYFMLGIMALSLLAIASRGEHIRGLILGGVGLLLAFVGQDPIQGLNYRFTFGIPFLEDGLKLVPVTVGLFALSQAIVLAEEGGTIAEVVEHIGGSVWEGVRESLRRPLTIIRGGIVGILLGIMPALGISTANIIAYFVEKQASKEPQTFGEGNPAGLLAPETSKAACVVGDLIPTFTLGIPGSATTAILMVALVIHNLEPGPRFFLSGSAPYTVFAGILLAQIAFFISGMLLARYFAKIVLVPNALLVPTIVLLSFIGSYAMYNHVEDLVVTLVFGLAGYLLHKAHWPTACLVLGMVLGDLIEGNFHRSLAIGDDSLSIFVTRPISMVLLICTLVFLVWPYVSPLFTRLLRGRRPELVAGLDSTDPQP
jgi:putative tricarboxylic transport membrane protein